MQIIAIVARFAYSVVAIGSMLAGAPHFACKVQFEKSREVAGLCPHSWLNSGARV